MKKLLLVLMTGVITIGLYAQSDMRNGIQNSSTGSISYVTAEQALEIGYTFMRTSGQERGTSNVNKQTMELLYTGTAIDSLTRAVTDCYYVFSLQPKGFVIVAADERVEPILGYSYDNNFVVEGMPDNVRDWMDYYGKQIKAAVDNDWQPSAEITEKWISLKSRQTMPTRSVTFVNPLIQTTWGQSGYYNQLCPADSNGRTVTGCVATAMAQIIRYWEWPNQGFNINSYDCGSYGTLSVDYNSATYDYNNMPYSLTSNSSSAHINEVAKLMYHCGVALNMNYGLSGSSAVSQQVITALKTFFAYPNSGTYIERSDYSDAEWANLIINELNNNRPVYYSATDQIFGGHAFVCDGYDTEEAFHINWGWNGTSDGYYLLSSLSPTQNTYNFTANHTVIVGISADGPFLCSSKAEMIFSAVVGENSDVQILQVRGHSLNSPINVSANNEFTISIDGVNYSDQVSLPSSGGALYVQYTPISLGSAVRTITLTSDTCSVPVSLYCYPRTEKCYGPKHLSGIHNGNTAILSWDSPISYSDEAPSSAIISWDSTQSVSSFGSYYSSNTVALYMLQRFDILDLAPYHDYLLKEVSFYASPYVDSFWVVVFQGGEYTTGVVSPGEEVVKQIVPVSTVMPNAWNTVSLIDDVHVNDTTEVWFGIIGKGSYVIAKGGSSIEKGSIIGLLNVSGSDTSISWMNYTANIPIKGKLVKDNATVIRYDIFKQNSQIGTTTSTTYTDDNPLETTCQYTVSAVWDNNCSQESSISVVPLAMPPIVTTHEVTNIFANSATCGGEVANDGLTNVSIRGICWSTNPNPTINNNRTISGNGTGSFTASLTNLTYGTTYYVRAYATNNAGTAYGNEVSFMTLSLPAEDGLPCLGYETVTDRDGNTYNTVSIGNQCWMRENLRVAVGTYGNEIDGSQTEPIYYINPDVNRPVDIYGYHYNWVAAKQACPVGWHLPSDAEWSTLTNHLGGYDEYVCGNISSYIAKALAANEGWKNSSASCVVSIRAGENNSSGFSAYPAGGWWPGFENVGCNAFFWTSTSLGETYAYYRSLFYNSATMNGSFYYKSRGHSVRCVRTIITATTNEASEVKTYTAVLNGKIHNPDDVDVIAKGFEWKAANEATYAVVNVTSDADSIGVLIEGLSPFTSYTYRAFVNIPDSTVYGEEKSFTTKCENVASLPYTDNFDDYTTSTAVETGVQPNCWEVIAEDVALTSATMPQVYCGFSTSGSYSLRLKNRCVYAMPSLDEQYNVQDLILTFKLRQPKKIYRLQVGVVNDDGVFQVVRTINNTSTDMEDITVNFSNYTGNGHRIAFRNTLASGSNIDYSVNYIDDLVLNITCGIYLLPYAENFDDCTTATTAETGVQPECWEVVSEDVALTNATKPQVYRGNTTSGSYSLRMKNRCVFAMPVLKNNANIQELAMTFKLRQPNAIYRLQVGVVNENGEFEVVKTINNASTEFENVKVKFSDYTGNGRRIAFRNTVPSSSTLAYSTNYIDDIVLDYTCDINELPYTEDFDNCTTITTTETGVQPNCWEVITEDVALTEATKPQVCFRPDFATSGDYMLRMKNRCVYAMPELENNISVPDLILTFKLRQTKAIYRLQVGVVDNQGNFNLVKTINNASTGTEDVMVDFSNYTGDGHRIAFRNTLVSGSTIDYSVNYLDDIVLSKRKKECSITIEMHDSYGDGWTGNKILVHNHDTIQEVTLDGGREGTTTLTVYDGSLDFEWVNGQWASECSFTITGPCLYYSGGAPAQGVFQTTMLDCEGGTPAVSSFTYWTENTCNSVIVHFENTSTDANVATWNIGNYSTNEWNIAYEFTESGSYPVTLTTNNSICGNSNSVTNNVQITLPEPITFTKDTVVCITDLPLIWYGHTFTGTDSYAFTLQAANGCDSTVTLMVYASENGLVSMSLGSVYYTQAASNERIVMVADYNNDNQEDLITRIHPSGEIRFYRNTGNTMVYDYSLNAQPYAFSSACDENNNGQASNTSSLMDFDNDGVTDLLVYAANHANCSSNAVRIYWGSATYPYFTDANYTELSISSPYCVGAYGTDLNNDGLTDVLIRNCGPTNLYMNEGNRVFTQTSVFNIGRDINVIFDDYNQDGNVDLCYTKNGWADGQWGMRLNKGNGDGTFNTSTIKNYTSERPLDGFLNFHSDPLEDNLPDIAFTCNNDGTNNSIVYIGEWNNSINNFHFATLGVSASEETRIVQAFDINGDNYEDLIIRLKTGNSYSAKAYLNDGHGNFTYSIPVLCNSSYYPYKLWREAGRILMAAYHGTARDSIVVYELMTIECGVTCPKIATLPYTENFDSYTTVTATETGVEPDCWKVVAEDVALTNATKPQLYHGFSTSGDYSLRLKNRCVYAMPALGEGIDIRGLEMSFKLRQANAVYRLQVGVVEENGSFTVVKTINNATTDMEEVFVEFSSYTGSGKRIAFRNTVKSSSTLAYSTNYIDDIVLDYSNACTIVELPYAEDFDSYTTETATETGVEPDCWEVIAEDVALTNATKPQLYHGYATSGDYTLRLKNRCVYAMPALGEGIDIKGLEMSFKLRQANAVYRLQVGVVEENGAFTVVKTINNSGTDMEDVVVKFSGYTGSGNRIAFRNTVKSGSTLAYSTNYIDDIVLDYTCDIVDLPYTEDFDSYTTVTATETGVEPDCWEVVTEDVALTNATRPQLYHGYATSGDYSLRLKNRCVYAMPALGEGIDIKGLEMTFKLRQPSSVYRLQVGVVEDNGGFTVVKTINNATTDMEDVVVEFSSYTGSGKRIAFRNTVKSSSTLSYSTNYIDDIRFNPTAKTKDVSPGDVIDADAMNAYLERITVYPNPTTGVLHIDAVDVQKVECYSQMGQLVGVYDNVNELNIGNLAKGVYTLRITVPQGVTMRKVVKK